MTSLRTMSPIAWLVAMACCCSHAAAQKPASSDARSLAGQYHRLNYLVVTPAGPDDGGDLRVQRDCARRNTQRQIPINLLVGI